MVQMEGVLDGWWMAGEWPPCLQQDCDVREEVVKWWFGLEYWELRWRVHLESITVSKKDLRKLCGFPKLWFMPNSCCSICTSKQKLRLITADDVFSPSIQQSSFTVKVNEITLSPVWCLTWPLTEALRLCLHDFMDLAGAQAFLIKWPISVCAVTRGLQTYDCHIPGSLLWLKSQAMTLRKRSTHPPFTAVEFLGHSL